MRQGVVSEVNSKRTPVDTQSDMSFAIQYMMECRTQGDFRPLEALALEI
jgi:hypothetical protein